jgi:hypothetical protein
MPKCLDCGNDRRFLVPITGYESWNFDGDELVGVDSGETGWDDGCPAECNECSSGNIEGDFI